MVICLVYTIKDTVTIILVSARFVQYRDFRKKEIWQVLLTTWMNPCMTVGFIHPPPCINSRFATLTLSVQWTLQHTQMLRVDFNNRLKTATEYIFKSIWKIPFVTSLAVVVSGKLASQLVCRCAI